MSTSIQESHLSISNTILLPMLRVVATQKLVDYVQLIDVIEEQHKSGYILIPWKLEGWQYSWKKLIEHIRLSSVASVSHSHIIFIVGEPKLKQGIETEISKQPWSYGIWVHEPHQMSSLDQYNELIEDKDYDDIYKLVAIIPPKKSGPHDRANIWGPYRLLKAICDSCGCGDDDKVSIERELAQEPYWKKKILNSNLARNVDQEKLDVLREKIAGLIKSIQLSTTRVCLIDDEADKGWGKAFVELFKNSEIKTLKTIKGHNFQSFDESYDLVLLDLRIEEKASEGAGDKIEIEKLSGIRALKKIRKDKNLVPVIMATASNKSWSYETAIQNGANGYWEKERPDLDVSSEYNLSNTINLLVTINDVLTWQRKILPIIKGLQNIEASISYGIAKRSIQAKTNTVIGQLYREQSKFIGQYYGRSGEQTAFLAIWSIFNDIVDCFLEKRDRSFLFRSLGVEGSFCSCLDDIDGKKYVLSDQVLNHFRSSLPTIKIPRQKYNFLDEKALILFILSKRSQHPTTRKRNIELFNKVKAVRNSLPWIHGHTQLSWDEESELEWKFEYLYDAINLWHWVFLGKPLPY